MVQFHILKRDAKSFWLVLRKMHKKVHPFFQGFKKISAPRTRNRPKILPSSKKNDEGAKNGGGALLDAFVVGRSKGSIRNGTQSKIATTVQPFIHLLQGTIMPSTPKRQKHERQTKLDQFLTPSPSRKKDRPAKSPEFALDTTQVLKVSYQLTNK